MTRRQESTRRRSGRAHALMLGWILVPSFVVASCGARSPLIDEVASDSSVISPNDVQPIPDVTEPEDAPPIACIPGKIPLVPATPVIDFVLDSSGSMNDPLDDTSPTSKWDALRGALAGALPPIDATTEIGAYIFPTSHNDTSCDTVPGAALEPATNNVRALLFKMATTTPKGGTPTALALQYTADDLLGLRTASNARAMVLATDGSPNCNPDLDGRTCTCTQTSGTTNVCDDPSGGPTFCLDDVATETTISTYAAQGIPTYVIGIESAKDAQFEKVLNAMAIAGGRPASGPTSYYAASSSADLNSAVTTIRDSVASCTYLTKSVPDDTGAIVVTLDGVTLTFDPTNKNGWDWSDKANGEIVLSGAACVQAASESSPVLLAEIRCGDADAASDAPSDSSSESGG